MNTEKILAVTMAMPEGSLLLPRDLLYLGSRSSIYKSFYTLLKCGKLLRIGRGTYVVPINGRFGLRPPSIESVVRSIESNCNEVIVASGAFDANALGFTTQVPIRMIFLTSGPSRTIRLGNLSVNIKHVSQPTLMLDKNTVGKLLRVLLWIGPGGAATALRQLKFKLTNAECETVCAGRYTLPRWMAKVINAEFKLD